MIAACGAAGVDTSEFTTPLLAVDGVRVAILFRELPAARSRSRSARRADSTFRGWPPSSAAAGTATLGIVMPGRFERSSTAVTRGA
jgi:hypothetical protein